MNEKEKINKMKIIKKRIKKNLMHLLLKYFGVRCLPNLSFLHSSRAFFCESITLK